MNIMLLSVSIWSGDATDMSPELRDLFHWISALIALPCTAYAGQPFFRSAVRAIRARQLNMDVPISLGVLLALGMSVAETANHAEHVYFDSAVMLLFFLLCGRYLEHAMRRKTRAVAGNLAALKAEVAHRFEHGRELVTVPAAALQPGDRLLVRPGERIPADGIVISGSSQIDEGLVTGETAPKKVGPGETVYAATVNCLGALTMRVTAAGTGTLIDEIERLLANALTARSTYLQLAERAARDRRFDSGRMVACRDFAARLHHHRHYRSHHHLPVCDSARRSRRAGGGFRRVIACGDHPQIPGRDRAPGRCRYRRI
jgi:Cu2+-exporting ATPase